MPSATLRLVVDDLEGVLAAFDDADAGGLIDLGAEGPVAIAHLDVEGAESAVLYVSAPRRPTTCGTPLKGSSTISEPRAGRSTPGG
jgi:hypothetical protein